MRIVADQAIPRVAAAFADLGEVRLRPGREIGPADLADARCLVARTVTRIDGALLDDTPVEFVGTATIGTDHVDVAYLERRGIAWTNAAGSNAEAAAEYVVSGLFELARRRGFDPFARRAGIVGYGNVGARLVDKLELLGIDCLVSDPPLDAAGYRARPLHTLDELLERCDLLSLHVPLTDAGAHPTRHLLDAGRLARLGPGAVLVNAARGPVVDNRALARLLGKRDDLIVFLDTWEGEPLLDRELLARVDLATPHIAGYSVEGRLRGTQMVLDAACAHFGLRSGWHMDHELPAVRALDPGAAGAAYWDRLFAAHCDIARDHQALLAGAALDDADFAAHFDGLRRVYEDRVEYARCALPAPPPGIDAGRLRALGFEVGDPAR